MGCISQKEGEGLGPPPRRNAPGFLRQQGTQQSSSMGMAHARQLQQPQLPQGQSRCAQHSLGEQEAKQQQLRLGAVPLPTGGGGGDGTRSGNLSEASCVASASAAHRLGDVQPPSPQSARVWDCGSKLYDMFELVSFSNRFDRSLLGIVPALSPPSPPPLHSDFAGVLRTFSLPIDFSLESSMPMAAPSSSAECGNIADPPLGRISEEASGHGSLLFDLQGGCLDYFHGRPSYIDRKLSSPHQPLAARCALSKLAHIAKKLLKFYTHLQCFGPPAPSSKRSFKHRKSCDKDIDPGTPTSTFESSWRLSSSGETVGGRRYDAMEEEDGNGGNRKYLTRRVHAEKAKWRKGGKHFHHHHHHYHHHFVHHVDQFSVAASDGNVCKLPVTIDGDGADCNPALRDEAASLRAESARLSCDTMAKLFADVNWN